MSDAQSSHNQSENLLDPTHQKRSRINRENQKKKVTSHKSGRKLHAVARREQVSDVQTSHDQSENPLDPTFKVGTVVHLLSIDLPKEVVAEDCIISKDPDEELDGMQLGSGFWIVRVNNAILPNEPLLINRPKIRMVGQAVKRSVLWRTIDVKTK